MVQISTFSSRFSLREFPNIESFFFYVGSETGPFGKNTPETASASRANTSGKN